MNLKTIFFLFWGCFLTIHKLYAQGIVYDNYFIDIKINHDSLASHNESGPDFSNSIVFSSFLSTRSVINYRKTYKGFKTPSLQNIYTIVVPKGVTNIGTFLSDLNATGYISSFYVDSIVYPVASCTTPLSVTDPFNNCEVVWDMNPKYHLEMTGAECAWSITAGDPDILIAVIDTEFDTTHPELFGKIESVFNPTPSSTHNEYHGTHTAGLIVANHNNSFGSAGLGKNLRVRGYRVGGVHNVRTLVLKAYEDGMRVINVSWEGISADDDFIASVEEMAQSGTSLVLASGNNPAGTDGHSAYNHIPGVIVVSSHDQNGYIGYTGHEYRAAVDLVAPGIKVYHPTANTSEYICRMRYGSGTSISAPLVAGTIGLMLSVNPCMSPVDIEYILKSTALPIADPSFSPTGYGGGRLDTYAAVMEANSFSSTTNISSNTTWSGERYVFGNVIVKSGRTLTITGKVHMGCWGKFQVEKNAKLIIDGGHITSTEAMRKWQGIEVFGNPEKNTYETAEHGMLEIKNNSIIENASYAVRNFFEPGYNGGGIIKISSSTFRNCIRSVELNHYPRPYWTGTWGLGSNCSITDTEFYYDDPDADKHPPMFELPPRDIYSIVSWNTMGGVVIKDCTFNMNIPLGEIPNESRGTAIYMSSSGAHIEGNSIEGFLRCIYVNNDMGLTSRQIKIIDNTFTDNYKGIDGFGDINTLIMGNNISNTVSWNVIGAASSSGFTSKRRAIYLNSSGLAKVIGNDIHYPFSATLHHYEYTYGIVANYTNALYNTYIGSNTLKNHTNHIHAQNNNRTLASYCNVFDGQYEAAISFVPAWIEHGLGDHGTGCDLSLDYRANNQFINRRTGSYQLKYDDYAMGSLPVPFRYYALNVPDERIDYVYDPSPAGVVVAYENCVATSAPGGEDPNKFCDNVLIPVPLSSSVDLSGMLGEFRLLKNNSLRFSDEAVYLYGEILRAYTDVYRGGTDSLIVFLEGDGTAASDLLLVPLYIEKGEYQMAAGRLSAADIHPVQKAALADYYTIVVSLIANNKWNELSLTPLQVQNLSAIAGNDSLIAYPYALSTLDRAGLVSDMSDYFPIFKNPADSSSGFSEMRTPESENSEWLSVYPNPAGDQFTIECRLPEEGREAHIAVFSITGRNVYDQKLDAAETRIQLSSLALDMAPGVYYVVLRQGHKDIQYKKIVITR